MPGNTNTILTERFLEFCTFREEGFDWYDGVITLYDIADGIARQVEEQKEVFHPFDDRPREWHIGRIIYFINDPSRITPIFIDNYCHRSHYGSRIYPTPIIDDGHHRFAAILYLGLPKFKACYSGRIDVLR